MSVDSNCIFCKIIKGQIPSRKAFEDDELLVLEDQHAPMLGRMLSLAPKLMRELGVTNGFRTLINTGEDGRQEVQHVHMHVMGGPRPWLKG
jgi:histidine triad (HIT) family protein